MSTSLVPRDSGEMSFEELLEGFNELLTTNSQVMAQLRPRSESLGSQRKAHGATKNIDGEAGYPTDLRIQDYQHLFDRKSWAASIASMMSTESWQLTPKVYEVEDADIDTEFELSFAELVKRHRLWRVLEDLDVVSGIGRFGIIVVGTSDASSYAEEIQLTFDPATGAWSSKGRRELVTMMHFSESAVDIVTTESDQSSPRYGMPTLYKVTVDAPTSTDSYGTIDIDVHWSRVFHLRSPDSHSSSRVYGTPRCQTLYDQIYDVWKVSAGSAEGYYQGCNPILSIESGPIAPGTKVDTDSVKKQMYALQNSLQKYLSLAGLSAKVLERNPPDPTSHFDAQIKLLSIATGIPARILMGTEEAKLAGEADSTHFGRRIAKRREKVCTDMIIRPFVEFLISIGVLPAANFSVSWEEKEKEDPESRSRTAKTWTEALVAYSNATAAGMFMPPEVYFPVVWGIDGDELDALLQAQQDALRIAEEQQSEEQGQGVNDDTVGDQSDPDSDTQQE